MIGPSSAVLKDRHVQSTAETLSNAFEALLADQCAECRIDVLAWTAWHNLIRSRATATRSAAITPSYDMQCADHTFA